MPAWIIQIIIAVVMMVASYALTPRPKSAQPAAKQMDSPTADAGKEIGVIFGTVTIKEPNCLGSWDKQIITHQESA